MFLGEYKHTIDGKGRFILPAKFRDVLGERFILTKGLDNCLYIYSLPEWDKLDEKVRNLPITDTAVRRFVRFFFGGAAELEADAQGRAMMPLNLREYAGISKDVVTLGLSNHIEIWSKENWNEYSLSSDSISEDIAERIASLGI